jgi:hypothetical protein
MNAEKTFKKLSLKNKYLDYELEEDTALLIVYQKRYSKRVRQLAIENNITIDIPPPQERAGCDPNGEMQCNVNKKKFKNEEDSTIFKDLYRKIAKQTHPDKTQNDEQSESILNKATKAKADQDLFTIFDICQDLDITIPAITESHVELLEAGIKEKEREIIKIKCSDPWIWHEADPAIRIQLEQKILQALKL